MRKGGNSKDDKVTSSCRLLRRICDHKRICLQGEPTGLSVPRHDRQALFLHARRPTLRLVSTLAQNANFEVGVDGGDRREGMGAASCSTDENANRFCHVTVSYFLGSVSIKLAGTLREQHYDQSKIAGSPSPPNREIRRDILRSTQSALIETGCPFSDSPLD